MASVLARAMSQNRDQRYATAAAMRAALNGTGEAATLIGQKRSGHSIPDRLPTTVAVQRRDTG